MFHSFILFPLVSLSNDEEEEEAEEEEEEEEEEGEKEMDDDPDYMPAKKAKASNILPAKKRHDPRHMTLHESKKATSRIVNCATIQDTPYASRHVITLPSI